MEDCTLTGGGDTSFLRWLPYDGVGRAVRNGLNFTERGFGVRGAVGVSDRKHRRRRSWRRGTSTGSTCSAVGVRWFHTGGIFAALSDSAAETVIEAVTVARKHGTVVRDYLNYRPSLWKAVGGQARAQEVNRAIAPHIDVMIGNEEDFTAVARLRGRGGRREPLGAGARLVRGDDREGRGRAYPNFSVIGTTLRTVHSASVNDWGAIAWSRATGVVQATHRERLEILDRVGGGDSFASGLIYGLLGGGVPADRRRVRRRPRCPRDDHPGDTTMVGKAEVLRLAGGGAPRRPLTSAPGQVR